MTIGVIQGMDATRSLDYGSYGSGFWVLDLGLVMSGQDEDSMLHCRGMMQPLLVVSCTLPSRASAIV